MSFSARSRSRVVETREMKVIQEGGLKKRKVVSSRKGLSGREVEVRSSENDKAVDSFFWGTRQDQ